jgi:hypothetical protein
VRELADAHVSLQACFAKVAAFFKDLTISAWQPPLLSPAGESDHAPLLEPLEADVCASTDVKYVAAAWRDVQEGASAAVPSVHNAVEKLIVHTCSCAFMSKEEGDRMLKVIPRRMSGDGGVVVGGGGGEGSLSSPSRGEREPSEPVERPATTRGWKGAN